jgi:hypothetical protein
VVPTSILSPDADMVVERTTYKSKLYQMEQARSIVFSNKKPKLTLGACGLGDWAGGDSGSKVGGKETVYGNKTKDQSTRIQIIKNCKKVHQ